MSHRVEHHHVESLSSAMNWDGVDQIRSVLVVMALVVAVVAVIAIASVSVAALVLWS